MKVLIVHPHMTVYGGAETLIVKLAQYLAGKGIENSVLTLSISHEIRELLRDSNLIIPSKAYPFALRSTSFFRAMGLVREIHALTTYVRKNIDSFDVVNVHNFPATWSLFPLHKPCVWMCNEVPELWNNPNPSMPLKLLRCVGMEIDELIVNRTIDMICVSNRFTEKNVMDRYHRKPEKVYYGVDYEFFSRGDAKRALEHFSLYDNFTLLHVGWIGPQKNQFKSIKVLEKLTDKIPSIRLIFAGKGNNPYENELRKYIASKNLEKYVTFTGHVDKFMVRDLYHACNVVLAPYQPQGGWLAPFEALCASKPIVVSYNMTASDIIEREKIGIVTDNFTEAILDIYSNPEKYLSMAEKGRKFVIKEISWETFSNKMLDIFSSIV